MDILYLHKTIYHLRLQSELDNLNNNKSKILQINLRFYIFFIKYVSTIIIIL
jgi:hypothetical protein